jgi:cathepsin A (carboxypeptidase C)
MVNRIRSLKTIPRPAAMYCNNVMISPFQQTGLNVYDVRKKCDVNKNPLCYDIANDIDHYLNTPATQKQLGVKRQYKSCQMNINLRFMLAGDWMKP